MTMLPNTDVPKSKSYMKEIKAQELEEISIEKLLNPSGNQSEVHVVNKNDHGNFGNPNKAMRKNSETPISGNTKSAGTKTGGNNKGSRSTRNEI